MIPVIPESMKAEHDELHAELVKATKVRGTVGAAAKAVARVLHSHFVREEEFAIPPLGLLRDLAEGKVSADMRDVLAMTEKLRRELPEMLEEHRQIVEALDRLSAAAKKSRKPSIARFAEKLKLHAKNEEEVAYPAAILIGEYLKMKLQA